jgi:hypothetical protein
MQSTLWRKQLDPLGGADMTSRPANIDLVSLEQSVFRRTLGHGLIDLAIGCMVLMFAVGPYTTSAGLGDFWGSAVFIPFLMLAALVLRFIYRRVVVPRLGHVDFAQPRKKRLRTWNIVAFVFCALAFGVGAISGSQFGLLPPIFHMVAFSVLVFAGFVVAGYYLELRRFYVYAVFIASAPLVGELLWRYAGVPHHGYPVTFGFAAALCLVVGFVLLIRFMLRHPLPPDSANPPGA